MRGAEAMLKFEPDWIIAMGGGSPIDAAKAMWIKYEYPEITFEEKMCIRDSRSYIPTEKEAALRPVTPAQQAEADLARIKAEKLPIPAGVQTALAEHYQALLHTNDFYQYLTLFKELDVYKRQSTNTAPNRAVSTSVPRIWSPLNIVTILGTVRPM